MATDFTSQITAIYQAVEYRNPPAAELAVYNASLQSGSMTLAQVQSAVINDPFTTTIVDAVIREYQAAFNRVPDQAGAAYWVGQIAANPAMLGNLNTIFANSTEFQARFGATATTPANTALVTSLYTNVYGRAPDTAGLQYWSTGFPKDASGNPLPGAQPLHADQLLQAFANAQEFVTQTTPAIQAFQQLEIAGTEPTTGSLFAIVPPNAPGQTFNLTTNIDTLAGGAGNDIFNATLGTNLLGTIVPTLNALDSIDGGGGNNVLNIADASGAAADMIPAGAVIKNIQTINLTTVGAVGTSAAAPFDATSDAALKALNIASNGADFVKASSTTAVNITNAAGTVAVVGGSVDTITTDNASAVSVQGVAGTSAVSVTGGAAITIVDANSATAVAAAGIVPAHAAPTTATANSITTVSISGQNTAVADVIDSDALSTLNLTNDFKGGVTISNASANQTLNLNLSNVGYDTAGKAAVETITDQTGGVAKGATTVNIATAVKSDIALVDAQATTLNVSGAGALTLDAASNLGGVTKEVITGSGGLTENASVFGANAVIDASGSTGTNTITLGAGETYTGGTGKSVITLGADTLANITAGSGTSDEIILNNAAATFTAGGTLGHLSGFEILGTGALSSGSFDLSKVSGGVSNVDVTAAPAGALTFTNAASSQTLSIDASLGANGAITLVQNPTLANSTTDSLTLNIGTTKTTGIDTSNAAGGGLNAPVTIGGSAPTVTTANVAGAPGNVVSTDAVATASKAPVAQVDQVVITSSTPGDTITETVAGKAVSVSVLTNNNATTAQALANAINADPTASAAVTASANNGTVTLTAKTAGTAGAFTDTATNGAGGTTLAESTTTAAANGTNSVHTLTFNGTDASADTIAITDTTTGTNLGSVAIAAGSTDAQIASAVATYLNGKAGYSATASANQVTVTATGDFNPHSYSTTDTINATAQVDTISLAGFGGAATKGDLFSETVNGKVYTYTATGGENAAALAGDLANVINNDATAAVTASTGGTSTLTLTAKTAGTAFTASAVTDATFAATVVGAQAITANGYETVTLNSLGAAGDLGINTVNLIDNQLKSLVLTGTEGLTLVTGTNGAAAALSSIDTSAMSKGALVNLNGVLPSEVNTGLTVKLGDASVTLTGDAGVINTTKMVDVITGGDGVDVINGTANGGITQVTLGHGNGDTVTLFANVNNTVTLGNGNGDVVTVAGGNNTISVGNGIGDVITTGNGNNTITVGNGADTVNVGSGLNTVTLGTGADLVHVQVGTNGNTYTSIANFVKGDSLEIGAGAQGTLTGFDNTKVALASTAVFQDYLDAAVKQEGGNLGKATWFQFGGDTYVVEDNSGANTFQNGTDAVVKLVGLVDLSGTHGSFNLATHTLTLA